MSLVFAKHNVGWISRGKSTRECLPFQRLPSLFNDVKHACACCLSLVYFSHAGSFVRRFSKWIITGIWIPRVQVGSNKWSKRFVVARSESLLSRNLCNVELFKFEDYISASQRRFVGRDGLMSATQKVGWTFLISYYHCYHFIVILFFLKK